jgi:hypothetical protein
MGLLDILPLITKQTQKLVAIGDLGQVGRRRMESISGIAETVCILDSIEKID